jgi:hypothetical protein
MSLTKLLTRHVFCGLGWVMAAAMLTVLYVACINRTDQAQDAKQKKAMKQAVEAQHGGADEAIRKYNNSQMQAKPSTKKEAVQ